MILTGTQAIAVVAMCAALDETDSIGRTIQVRLGNIVVDYVPENMHMPRLTVRQLVNEEAFFILEDFTRRYGVGAQHLTPRKPL